MPDARIDPDPFGVVVGVAGIVGGLGSAVSLYQQLAMRCPAKSKTQIEKVLRQAKDVIRYIEVDVQILQEIISEAEIPGDRGFRLGRRAFLTSEQFKRYDKTADQLLNRLRLILKATNRLNRLLPTSAELDRADVATHLESTRGRIERILRDPGITIDTAMQDLLQAIRQLTDMADELLTQQ